MQDNAKLFSRIPEGKLDEKWSNRQFEGPILSPGNRLKYRVIVVGTGLAGASAAATLSELGYQVDVFCFHESPRRAHSVAAQGGINAAKNYPNDGDSVRRLFYDTLKGGDYRSREANVYRLAEVSNQIIDHCVSQGVPFAREYSGHLSNRSFGGAQVSRTFYSRGQTGQQLLLGAYSALSKEISRQKTTRFFGSRELMDIVELDGRVRGIVTRHLRTGEVESFVADAVVLATGGYGNLFYLSTNAMQSNVSATYKAYKRGAFFANPCFTQIHPTCIPIHGKGQSKLTLMSESLRNDGRVWVPRNKDEQRSAEDIPEEDRHYYLEERYPSFGNLVPRDVASRNAKERCDKGFGIGDSKQAVYLDFKDAIQRDGRQVIEKKYGNLFEMYERITGDSPYQTPMKIYPAVHYTMGGLWVDYDLMSTMSGLFVIGEANFSDHGANRLGASALMQGLADGYFILPVTIARQLSLHSPDQLSVDHSVFVEAKERVVSYINKVCDIKGQRTVDDIHRELGLLLWDKCGMSRTKEGLEEALKQLPVIKNEFWTNVCVPGHARGLNQSLEKALRLADFIDFSELLLRDALHREESCGGHFREESQTEEGEAQRIDELFSYVSVWEYEGEDSSPSLHKESLQFEMFKPTQRSYK